MYDPVTDLRSRLAQAEREDDRRRVRCGLWWIGVLAVAVLIVAAVVVATAGG